MKKYIYTNPTPTWITVGERDVYLEAGNEYELPAENAYIAALIEQEYLVPVPEKKTNSKKDR